MMMKINGADAVHVMMDGVIGFWRLVDLWVGGSQING